MNHKRNKNAFSAFMDDKGRNKHRDKRERKLKDKFKGSKNREW